MTAKEEAVTPKRKRNDDEAGKGQSGIEGDSSTAVGMTLLRMFLFHFASVRTAGQHEVTEEGIYYMEDLFKKNEQVMVVFERIEIL